MAEIELDKETGSVTVLDYKAVVDCGTPVNPNLARVQTEGGIVQGIGMALFEDVHYTPAGRILENSLMQYKIPTRLDMGRLQVEFEASYEPTGPFGAKSIGEIVINTPGPGHRARGVPRHRHLVPRPAHHAGKSLHGAARPAVTHVILLAAGSSRRFGGNKLLAPWRGRPLYRYGLHTLAAVCAARADAALLVVTNTPAIAQAAAACGAHAVPSPHSAQGQSASIRAGLDAAGPLAPGDFLLFAVADQPLLRAATVHRLLDLAVPGTWGATAACGAAWAARRCFARRWPRSCTPWRATAAGARC